MTAPVRADLAAPHSAVAILDADGALVDYGGGAPDFADHYQSAPGQPEETITGVVVRVGKGDAA